MWNDIDQLHQEKILKQEVIEAMMDLFLNI